VYVNPHGRSRNTQIDAGQGKWVTLSRHDLSIWDVVKQGWRKPIGVTVGASGRDKTVV